MNRTAYDKFRIPFHFFVPTVFILLGALLLGMIAYTNTSKLVERETIKNNLAVLNQTRSILDRRLAEIEMIAYLVANDTKVVSFQYVRDPLSGTNPYKMYETVKKLFNYPLTNHFLIDYYLVFKSNNMIFAPDKVYDLDQFYNMQLQVEGMDVATWRQSILANFHTRTYYPSQNMTYMKKEHSVLQYVHSFGNQSYYGGAVVMMIDNNQIRGMLSELDLHEGGYVYVADSDGNIVSYVAEKDEQLTTIDTNELGDRMHDQMQINGQQMLVTQSKSTYNSWTYISVQPLKQVLNKVTYLKTMITVIFVAALIFGLAIAAFFAYKQSRPWNVLMSMLARPQPDEGTATYRKNPLDAIQTSVKQLIENNEQLQERLTEQLPLLQNSFFDRLLTGQFNTKREIEISMAHLGLNWNHPYYVAAIVHFDQYMLELNEEILQELDIHKLAVQDLVNNHHKDHLFVQDIHVNQMALLINLGANSVAEAEEKLKTSLLSFYEEITQTLQVRIWIAVGTIVTDIVDISRSFEEAGVMVRNDDIPDQQAILYQFEQPSPIDSFYFPTDVELRLLNLVKSGNVDETNKLVAQIRERNQQKNVTPAMKKVLLYELLATFFKSCESLGGEQAKISLMMEPVLKNMEYIYNFEEVFSQIGGGYVHVAAAMNSRKKSHNELLKVDLLAYINENYNQSSLSLTVLADHFQTSEAYISYFFKEQTGENFSDYLETLRMNKVKHLLLHSEHTINEIAGEVGYVSLNTFSRAFKRSNGMSATEFRKINR
ncbi:helix-turn-helix domain-containing protein [Paenibacillus yanchengensis]|uniref:Helix-turn-helix domain-containing protein n=1 Tax=Paenibacillus yanchengensis TaxID=2035833 RepID=A0ABW4YJS9_9BACL